MILMKGKVDRQLVCDDVCGEFHHHTKEHSECLDTFRICWIGKMRFNPNKASFYYQLFIVKGKL